MSRGKTAKQPGYQITRIINGTTYVYQCISKYDKVKKQSFNKQVCIGKYGPDGAFIPNARYREQHKLSSTGEKITVTSKVIGVTQTLSAVAEAAGLTACVTKSLGRHRGAQALALAYYVVVRGNPLSYFPSWASYQKLPGTAKALSSQDISAFLTSITTDEIEKCFSRWAAHFTREDTLCMDLTSVSSYSACNELVKNGFNRDREHLEQVNILGLFSASKMLPVAVRMLPGNIADVTVLVNELVHFKQLGLAHPMMLLDKGFDSEHNRNRLLDARLKFLMMADGRRSWLKAIQEKHRDSMRVPSKLFYYQDDRYYAVTELFSLGSEGNRRCYAHIYYCSRLAENRLNRFNEKLHAYYGQLSQGAPLSQIPQEFQQYFTVKETPKRGRTVLLDEAAAVQKERSFSAMFVLLTNVKMDAQQALRLYRERDSVEKFFDDMKNSLDMKRLRVHNSTAARSRLFIQYLAAILLYLCRNKLGLYKTTNATIRSILEDLSGISEIIHNDRYGSLITESTVKQREVLAQLGVDTDSWL